MLTFSTTYLILLWNEIQFNLSCNEMPNDCLARPDGLRVTNVYNKYRLNKIRCLFVRSRRNPLLMTDIGYRKYYENKNSSQTGNRTPATAVRAPDPNH